MPTDDVDSIDKVLYEPKNHKALIILKEGVCATTQLKDSFNRLTKTTPFASPQLNGRQCYLYFETDLGKEVNGVNISEVNFNLIKEYGSVLDFKTFSVLHWAYAVPENDYRKRLESMLDNVYNIR